MKAKKAKLTRAETIRLLKEKLKNNPKALAELDMFDYQETTVWLNGKMDKQAAKISRVRNIKGY